MSFVEKKFIKITEINNDDIFIFGCENKDLTKEILKKVFDDFSIKFKTSKKLKLKFLFLQFDLVCIDDFVSIDKVYTIEVKKSKKD